MTFVHPWALLLLPIAIIPFWLKGHQGQTYSWLAMVPQDRASDIANFAIKIITSLIIVCIILALSTPQSSEQKLLKTGKGAQTVMVIDRSVSMNQPFAGDVTSGHVAEIKSKAARRLITQFIDSRPDDMMGVVGFTNSALYGVKITTNRTAIHSAINAATTASINQTNIGAGITQAAALFDDIQNSGSRAIILLSDGAGKLSPRVQRAIRKQLVSKNLNLYWIVLREPGDVSIFGDNSRFTEENMPLALRLDKFFQSLKIKYKAYEADDPTTLQSAIQDIDSREKQTIQYSVMVAGHDYADDFILLVLILSICMLIVKNLRVKSWQVT